MTTATREYAAKHGFTIERFAGGSTNASKYRLKDGATVVTDQWKIDRLMPFMVQIVERRAQAFDRVQKPIDPSCRVEVSSDLPNGDKLTATLTVRPGAYEIDTRIVRRPWRIVRDGIALEWRYATRGEAIAEVRRILSRVRHTQSRLTVVYLP